MYKIPIKLSKSTEISYLQQALKNNECLGYGSSRIVFGIDNKTVIKVALDNRGQMQNKHELDFFSEHSDLCGDIYAYGSHILVCDRMSENYADIVDDLMSDFEREDSDESIIECLREHSIYDEQEIIHIVQGFRVAMDLCDAMGYTGDNSQVGFFTNGYVAAFDFGYLPADFAELCNIDDEEEYHNRQVGDVTAIMCQFTSAQVIQFVIDKLMNRTKGLKYNRRSQLWNVKYC